MPTPSSNTPSIPSELPSRSHSSSCPEDLSPPRSRHSDNDDGLDMNLGSEHIMSPEATSVPAIANVQNMTMSPSTTDSPHSDSRDGTYTSVSEPAGIDSLPFKSTEEQQHAQGGLGVAVTGQQSSKYDVDTSSADLDKLDDEEGQTTVNQREYEPPMGFDFSNFRVIPTSLSSFLRPKSRFSGSQQSERQTYAVQVEIKYVDLRESFLCGYLKIEGLTKDNPTLTTYFEGEIIGNQYDFLTKHQGWGATEKIDLSHWGKFSAFRQYSKQVRKGVAVTIPNLAQRENIFMRWKEQFVVPDHRVTSLNGASFEGFYYICFNQKVGSISGIYFHHRSERFQQLELTHVEDRGCFGAFEFR